MLAAVLGDLERVDQFPVDMPDGAPFAALREPPVLGLVPLALAFPSRADVGRAAVAGNVGETVGTADAQAVLRDEGPAVFGVAGLVGEGGLPGPEVGLGGVVGCGDEGDAAGRGVGRDSGRVDAVLFGDELGGDGLELRQGVTTR